MLALATILATTALFSMTMLLVLGSLMRSGVAGVRQWFIANLLVVLGVVLLELRNVIPDFLSIVAANSTLALSGAFYYAGSAHFLKRPPYWSRMLCGVAAVFAAMFIWRYLDNNINARAIAFSSFNTVMFLALGVLLMRHQPPLRRSPHFVFGAALAWAFAILQVARVIVFVHTPPVPGALLTDNLVNLALLTVSAIAMPSLTMLAVMMIHDSMLAQMEEAINHDHLTAALSRKRFECVATDTLSQAAPLQPVSLLLIDLDHFKQINDTWGHAAGDEVLRAFAAMARSLIRPGDVLGRLGGEEFGLLLPRTTLAETIVVAERLRKMAEEHIVEGPFGRCRYSISIGIAYTTLTESLDHLCARADRALYGAKNQGRNRISVSEIVADLLADANPKAAASS